VLAVEVLLDPREHAHVGEATHAAGELALELVGGGAGAGDGGEQAAAALDQAQVADGLLAELRAGGVLDVGGAAQGDELLAQIVVEALLDERGGVAEVPRAAALKEVADVPEHRDEEVGAEDGDRDVDQGRATAARRGG
jgi:hypothetical protein